VRESVLNPLNDIQVNIGGSVVVMECCQRFGVPRLIFSSTGGVIYGEQEYFPADENHPTRPISPYAVAKLSIEKFLFYYHRERGLNAVALRFANAYGPRQNPFGEAGVVAIFCRRLLDGKPAVIYGDGRQTRDYIYVYDLVEASLAAMDLSGFHVMNVGTGIETDVLTIFNALNRISGARASPQFQPPLPGDQRRSSIDSALAQRLLNWSPKVEFERGLALTLGYFRDHER
jgi:UDP-glucose 4-epimerase